MKLSDIWQKINDRVNNSLENGFNIRICQELLRDYNGDDYLQSVQIDYKKYNRHVVASNQELEMVIITWAPNQSSGFHGHPGECVFRVLEGSMVEELIGADSNCKTKITLFNRDDVGYIDNSIGTHNVYTVDGAVSLHIYSPPFIK